MAVYLGLDLGTDSTRITVSGKSQIICDPSVAAVDAAGNVIAAGAKALLTQDRAPGTVTLRRPVISGAVTDFNLLAEMLDKMLESAAPRVKKQVAAAVNCSMSEADRRTLTSALSDCRCGSICLVESPLAALASFDESTVTADSTEYGGTLLCDIGAGSVEAYYIRAGEILRADKAISGGDAADREIITYIRRRYDVALTELQAKELKHSASLSASESAKEAEVTGVDVTSGIPRKVKVPLDGRFVQMCAPQTEAAAKLICSVLANLPRQGENILNADRILVYGGGAAMVGMEEYLSAAVGRPVTVSPSPSDAVSRGLRSLLEKDAAALFRAR